jgi:hypothetical protein
MGLITTPLFADIATIGSDGIDAIGIGLDGSGIEIGQLESGRSAKPMLDDADLVIQNTDPTGVYIRTDSGTAGANSAVTPHATLIAQIMIGDVASGVFQGVSPEANLHSASVGSGGSNPDELTPAVDVDFALTGNRLAKLPGAEVRVRAINVSAGRGLQEPVENNDGSTYITKFIDWSARKQDVLYVAAWGNDNSPQKRAIADNFNGLTIAASKRGDPMNNDNVYRKFADINATFGQPADGRSLIDLLAPGEPVFLRQPGSQPPSDFSGSSAAAPHVTGTTALLQQHAQKQMDLPTPNPRFDDSSQRHEVMKAVMINSADKLAGVQGSSRDVPNRANQLWTDTPAYMFDEIPLDPWIGAGHLNARRSLQQFLPGEYDPGQVDLIGWDYHGIGSGDAINEYAFTTQAGGYLAATLIWDRIVTKDPDNTTYLEGEPLTTPALAMPNLDLYLLPANATDFGPKISSSVSMVDNVEHIFFNISAGGQYKLSVHNNGIGGSGLPGNYALAWWFGNAPPLAIAGDYNGDGSVDAADYIVWRKGGPLQNETVTPGTVTIEDYNEWRSHFGSSGSGSGGGASVPEPLSTMLSIIGVAFFVTFQSRRCL